MSQKRRRKQQKGIVARINGWLFRNLERNHRERIHTQRVRDVDMLDNIRIDARRSVDELPDGLDKDRLQKIRELELYFLRNLSEDALDGSSFDCTILDYFDAMRKDIGYDKWNRLLKHGTMGLTKDLPHILQVVKLLFPECSPVTIDDLFGQDQRDDECFSLSLPIEELGSDEIEIEPAVITFDRIIVDDEIPRSESLQHTRQCSECNAETTHVETFYNGHVGTIKCSECNNEIIQRFG